ATSSDSGRRRLLWGQEALARASPTGGAAGLKIPMGCAAGPTPPAYKVLPRRWVVERTFAWISKHRRTVRDYERLPASHEAMIIWAMIALMTRRLAPTPTCHRTSGA